jgi:hypothetical protein
MNDSKIWSINIYHSDGGITKDHGITHIVVYSNRIAYVDRAGIETVTTLPYLLYSTPAARAGEGGKQDGE